MWQKTYLSRGFDMANSKNNQLQQRPNGGLDPSTPLSDGSKMLATLALAKALATSDFMPDHFRSTTSKGKDNPAAEGNLLVLMDFVHRTGLAIQPLAQHSYVIGGKLSFESKLALAMLNQSGRTIGPPKYSFDKETKTMHVACRDRETNEWRTHSLSWEQVVQAKWDKNPAWVNQRFLMMKYRVLMQLIRTTWPEVLLGFVSTDEAYEMMMAEGKGSTVDFMESRRVDPQRAISELETGDPEISEVEGLTADEIRELEAEESQLFATHGNAAEE